MTTTNLEELDLDRLTIGYPDQVSEHSHFSDIRYNGQELLFQTPKISFYNNSNKYITICFYNYKYNSITNKFIDRVKAIEDLFYKNSPYIWKKIGENSSGKEFISSIRYSKDREKAYINLNIQVEKGKPIAQVYDKDKKAVSLDYIAEGSTGYCIVYLRGVWRKGDKMGLSFVLVQSKVYLPIYKLDECIILDPDIDNPNAHYHNIPPKVAEKKVSKEEHPIYGKFVKMKRMGIPEPAIAIKCSTEGVLFNDFLAYLSDGDCTSTISKPISLPLPMANKINPMMLQGVQLKKVSKEELEAQKQKQIMSRLKIENPSGFKPPSSSDLLNILKRLKKTNLVDIDT